jgi:predicted neuraminidase
MKWLSFLFPLWIAALPWVGLGAEKPFLKSELIFPLEHWHNHGSCIVEAPNGDLLVCWFNGSGERKADDVKIEGARLRKGAKRWSERFTMADTPEYPDTNCAMFIDPMGRLWLMWPTILANEWHTALMKYKISSDYRREGSPRWQQSEILHVTPGTNFITATHRYAEEFSARLKQENWPETDRAEGLRFLEYVKAQSDGKLQRRLGWMTRAHPFVLEGKRLIVPLYSDGFSFSLMAISDDWGGTWHASAPLCGPGNIQPSIVRRQDGSLYTLMRDNGPPPKRLMQSESRDRGETWSPVTDSDLPNPGAGAEIINLSNGHWALINNNAETHRGSLVVQISDDEGRTWKWQRHLERDEPGKKQGSYHYPSLIQSRDGTLHASYSYHISSEGLPKDALGRTAHKSIKHAHFNLTWVQAGD